MRKACGESHMKSILAVGELCNLTNVYRASLVAMMAGSDFIKTSTGNYGITKFYFVCGKVNILCFLGKETVNATLPIGLVMCRAIRAFNRKTNFKVCVQIRFFLTILNFFFILRWGSNLLVVFEHLRMSSNG